MRIAFLLVTLLAALLAAAAPAQEGAFALQGSAGTVLRASPTARFDEPWARAVLPDGRMLVTEKGGARVPA